MPTSLLGFGFLLLLAPSAPAEATRPMMRTEIALQHLKMSMPIDLNTAMEKNMIGLDQEPASVKKAILAQARQYIAYRKRPRGSSWLKSCAKAKDNPFCDYEKERLERSPSRPSTSSDRAERREIASELKAGQFENVNGKDYSDVIWAVSRLGDMSDVTQTAKQVLEKKECVPPAVASALAYKLEEAFPAEDVVETSRKLYTKASECGSNMAAATASFRLGLIKIWKNQCDGVTDLMLKVEKTPEASQYHARAKYWRFYCAGVTGNETAKLEARQAILREHPMSFQNLAINGDDTAQMSQVINGDPVSIAFRSLVRSDLNPMLRASEALIQANSEHLASEMLDRNVGVIGSLEPEVRLYTAMLLNRIGEALPKFKILSGLFQDVPRMVSKATLKLYFPLWYYDMVKPRVDKVDPLLVISLIRQESAFNADARSMVGARGLMQVMPATARMIASVRTKKLYEPETNIRIGTTYLLKRLHQYDGDVELTLAAYNAGFSRVDQWRKRYPTDNKMLFLDFIPFRETREYVSSILRNYYWYVTLYEREKQDAEAEASEGVKVNAAESKVISILNANAGVAAGVMEDR